MGCFLVVFHTRAWAAPGCCSTSFLPSSPGCSSSSSSAAAAVAATCSCSAHLSEPPRSPTFASPTGLGFALLLLLLFVVLVIIDRVGLRGRASSQQQEQRRGHCDARDESSSKSSDEQRRALLLLLGPDPVDIEEGGGAARGQGARPREFRGRGAAFLCRRRFQHERRGARSGEPRHRRRIERGGVEKVRSGLEATAAAEADLFGVLEEKIKRERERENCLLFVGESGWCCRFPKKNVSLFSFTPPPLLPPHFTCTTPP